MFIPKQSHPFSYKIKSSEFICYLFELQTQDQASELLQSVKKEHHTANHHCWAWRWVAFSEDIMSIQEHQSDDGEPRGTAGFPILHRLQHHDLVNTLAVVVRYFGGTKLGKSGLIESYSEATQSAIVNSLLTRFEAGYELHIRNSYELENLVKQWLHHQKTPVLSSEYSMHVERKIFVPLEDKAAIEDSLKDWAHTEIECNWSELKLLASLTS